MSNITALRRLMYSREVMMSNTKSENKLKRA